MCSGMWRVHGKAVLFVAAALALVVSVPAGTADSQDPPPTLSALQYELAGEQVYEVSVRVASASAEAQSTQIGFFYTEERTRRHNLIGVVTVVLIGAEDWVRPAVKWDTSELNPGLYKLRAVIMDTPSIFVDKWEDRDEGTYDYVPVLLQGAGLVWPPQSVTLELTENQAVGKEILCSIDWDRLDGYPTPTVSLADVWNVGGEPISASSQGTWQLLVEGVVTLVNDDGTETVGAPFDFGGTIEPADLEIQPGTSATVAIKHVDLESFVREALVLYAARQESEGEPLQMQLGNPISIRTALSFTTKNIAGAGIPASLQSFDAYLPGSTDPSLSEAAVFSLLTDVEDFVFPKQGTCTTSPDTEVVASSTLPPVPSLDTGARWNTYVVGEDQGGHTLYLLSRRGQYGGIYGSPHPIWARDSAGNPTSDLARIVSGPVVGVGEDPGSGFSNKPILFFCADDGFLRALMDLGTAFSTVWNPDGWTANAIQVPTGDDQRLSPPALLPRPETNTYTFLQDRTEFVVVGSSEGLYVYRLDFGGTGQPARYRSYTGYDVTTDFPPFTVKQEARRLVYFFAKRDGDAVTRLWGVDVSTTGAPESLAFLSGGDAPSTSIVCPKTSELDEQTAYLFFGTEGGRLYAISTAAGAVGGVMADTAELGSRILGLRAVPSGEADGYDVYANTSSNRLYHLFASTAGGQIAFGDVTAYSPPYSNRYLMGPSLEVLPGNEGRPGMAFLSYVEGPLVALDLEDPSQLLQIQVWASVWEGAAEEEKLEATPFEFFGDCATGGCAGFGGPLVTTSGADELRLLVGAADGKVYAFDLSASILPPGAIGGETGEPVSP